MTRTSKPRVASAVSSPRAPAGPGPRVVAVPAQQRVPGPDSGVRLPVAVVGATGAVGQRFVQRLADHPWFEVTVVAAGTDRVGRPYGEAVSWLLETPIPPTIARLRLVDLESVVTSRVAAVFSALPSSTAGPYESRLAAAGHHVFTNAKDHRMDADVPLLLTEVNPDHLQLVHQQPGPGWIVANGNCSAIILELPLAALSRSFGVESVHVTTMQSLSGAGHPGVASMDILDNILTHIPGEEEKLATEPEKTLGRLVGQRPGDAADPSSKIQPLALQIQATCTRSNVQEGHTESVHVRLAKPAALPQIQKALAGFRGPADVQRLPGAPAEPIVVREEADRPQPRKDRDAGNGMSVSVGRLRLDATGRDLRFVVLGSNTVRGAAGQSILNAEYAHAQGLLTIPAQSDAASKGAKGAQPARSGKRMTGRAR